MRKTFIFPILIALPGLLFTQCKERSKLNVQPVSAPRVPAYYAKMSKVRNWTGYYHNVYSDPNVVNNYDISGSYPDTSFAVTFIDTNTIALFSGTYAFSSWDSLKHIYYFGQGYYFMNYPAGEGVAYFPDNDSIVWGFRDTHMTWAYWSYLRVRHTY